jgi:hypothetical protein
MSPFLFGAIMSLSVMVILVNIFNLPFILASCITIITFTVIGVGIALYDENSKHN